MKQETNKLTKYNLDLINWIKETKPTIYTTLKHVSKSGMFRAISVWIIKDNQPLYLNYIVSEVNGLKQNLKHGGVSVRGAGMDMGFDVVYTFSRRIYKDTIQERDTGYNLTQRWF